MNRTPTIAPDAIAERIHRSRKFDADEILPRLWQGSDPPRGQALAAAGFHILVLCAMERQHPPDQYPGLEQVYYAPMDDGNEVPRATAIAAARFVAQAHQAGRRIYVACAMGRNRSGIVTALAVRRLTGWTGAQAVKRVQSLRPLALMNLVFVEWLRGLPAPMRLVGSTAKPRKAKR